MTRVRMKNGRLAKKKVVDKMKKSCESYEKWVGKEDTDEYLEWYEDHMDECTANHEGSSGKMEVDGVIEMFRRSVEWFSVKYKRYVGDGDSKTFKNLLEADVYNGKSPVEKSECVLHVKKRMFRRVKEAKKALTQLGKAKIKAEAKIEKEAKGKRKSEGETKVTQKPKRRSKKDAADDHVPKVKNLTLTNKLMVNLSAYYGLAIMRNENSVEEMKKAVWATYYHLISTDEKPQHFYCPEGPDSWCKYQKCKAEKKEHTFLHPPTFDGNTVTILKPIYEELSSDDLLKRCLGRNTQNNNEAFNHCVWNLAPKHIFVSQKTLEIAAWTSACTFNEGFLPVLQILEAMGVTIGPHAIAYECTELLTESLTELYNRTRISKADKDAAHASKTARMSRRSEKQTENEAYEETEGLLYAAGIDD